MRKHIFLTGFMGSGKSRIGKILAQQLKVSFKDTDELISEKNKMTVSEIFEQKGEDFFRESEKEIVRQLASLKEKAVISLGGGALLDKKNLKLIKKKGVLIYIESSLDAIWDRIKDKTKRPLLMEKGQMPDKSRFMSMAEQLFQSRMTGYKNADIKFNRDGIEADAAARQIYENHKKLIS